MSRIPKSDGKDKLKTALAALKHIAEMPPEKDEWDGAEKYAQAQAHAMQTLRELSVEYRALD